MKIHIFDDLKELNVYLAGRKSKNTNIKTKSFLVSEDKDENGQPVWRFVDRFFVTEE